MLNSFKENIHKSFSFNYKPVKGQNHLSVQTIEFFYKLDLLIEVKVWSEVYFIFILKIIGLWII